ncbi:MAG: alpha-2-macroglobulin family protein, partial [Anaerolineales bacterium]|nr:alpha-2-macroglobulin family protein [Anaerolineales bacterium]
WSDYYAPPNRPVAYIYTDRPVYRPGQPVYYKGILRLDDDLKYSLPDLKEARVTISNFEEVVAEETLTLTQYGSFSGEFTLDQNARLGNYAISVAFPGSEFAIGTVSFDVAEYRKPEFMVSAEVAEEDVLAGASFTATVQAEYYSGGAVAGSPVRWSLASLPYTFGQDGDLARFSFADLQEDVYGPGQEEFYASKIIAEGEGQLDATGALSLTLLADLLDAPTSRMFVFEATVMDISGNPVTSRDSLRVHKSAVYPGVRSLGYVGQVGEEQTFEIISVDWDGTPLPEQLVDVEILERRWHSVQEQDAQGRVKWTSSVQEIPVASFTGVLMDADGLARVSFTPANGGVFAARVTARDASGNQAVSAAYMWVAGDEYVPWQQTNDRGFKLIADKDSYLPGETAELLIASPFQGKAYALVTVERGRIQQHEVIELESNSTIYKLPVDAQMAPNVYLSVVIVKGVDETNPRPNFKMGVAQLKVDTQAQQLRMSLQPDREQAGPRDQVRYTVTTRDMDGNPVQAEVSLALTDLATLSLRDPNAPPLLDYFYASRSLGVWTSVPIVVSLEEFNAFITEGLAEGKAMGAGGGKGEGELGIIEVREEFPDTAFWEAHLVTSPTGEASVSVTLPDNLTTWRMDARAVSKDTRVGQATHDLVSSKPLLVRPQTPRFFIVGDKARLGSAVHNNSDETLNVSVRLEGKGFSVEGDAMQVLEIAANSQAYVTWEVNINPDATRVDLVVSAEGGGYRDASRPPVGTLDKQGIPVYRFEAHETVGTSGVMADQGVRIEAIRIPEMMQSADGNLTIQLAPSLAAGMTDGLQYLEDYPYDCVEQAISRFLPNLMYLRALKADGKEDAQMAARIGQQVNITLQRLVNWQNADGGWGWWSRDKSHPMTSAYVVLGLLEAQQAGYTVDEGMLQRGERYLVTQLLPKTGLREPTLRNRQAFILYVLARAGKADASKSVQLFDERLGMSYFARAFLANTLYQIDPRDERIQTLLSDLSSAAILSAGGTHWEEESEDVWNWNTDTRTTAVILAMLSQIDPENLLNANAARWLMSHRTRGHWNGTQETAWSLMALVNWMLASGERGARYDYGLAVNGKEVLSGSVSPETIDDAKEKRIDVNELLREQANKVAFVKGAGSGNLYYTAYMDVSLPVEQVQALDRGIVVSRNYYTNDEQNELAEEAHVGEVLVARITLVVPHDLHYVVVDDPLPAGLEPIDQSLKTSPQNETPNQYSWKDLATSGWGWWYFDHVELRDEKVTLSADYLPAGTYVYSYLVQVMTPGEFKTIPPTAQEFYFPDVYGRGSGSLFTVLP